MVSLLENNQLPQEILRIFTQVSRSRSFWELSRMARGESMLLTYLFEHEGCTPKELAQVMRVSPARITVILSGLECKRLVRRVSDGKDKRRLHVRLTETGIAAVQTIREEALGYALQWCENLGEADAQTLIRITDRLLKMEAAREQQTKHNADCLKEGDGAEG